MIEIKKDAINEWEARTSCKLRISDSSTYRSADLFLSNNPFIQASIEKQITNDLIEIDYRVSTKNNKHYRRIGATSLNKSLKENISKIEGVKLEVEYKDGFLYDSPKTGGFDFALFDEVYNIHNFRNYCLGYKGIHKGEEYWTKVTNGKKDWAKIASEFKLDDELKFGQDLDYKKKKPTIIGEIQFGNWALFYYDLFKVIHLDNLFDIDLLVYITANLSLKECLSQSIVNYQDAKDIINKHSSIIKFPIWLIGLDLDS